MTSDSPDRPPVLPLRRIFSTWGPLAASWLLMGAEIPALSMVIARMANPEINLAAFSGVVFPLALIIEAPVIMLLAASTALSRDMASYLRIRQYMLWSGGLLTLLHILAAFTPLYYVIVEGILKAPQEIVEPARLGLMIMTPWTWSIAYRRFNQGVLIRFGHSPAVGIGTVVRLCADVVVLLVGYWFWDLPGIAVGTAAQAVGVMSEALYVSRVVKPVIERELKLAPAVDPPLSWSVFWAFYIPLVMTSLLTLLVNPIGSAAINRMPLPVASLAAWGVINSFIFMLRSLGIAFNEVVVAMLDQPRSSPSLMRFANILAGFTTLSLVILAATPLSSLWFEKIMALSPNLVHLAKSGVWLALSWPAISVVQSWYQGVLLYGRRTRGITESVGIYLTTSLIVYLAGIFRQDYIGLEIALYAVSLSLVTQTAWLWLRCRPALATLVERDR
jgi:hypothetical protein